VQGVNKALTGEEIDHGSHVLTITMVYVLSGSEMPVKSIATDCYAGLLGAQCRGGKYERISSLRVN
jgi:hypothetical protein